MLREGLDSESTVCVSSFVILHLIMGSSQWKKSKMDHLSVGKGLTNNGLNPMGKMGNNELPLSGGN